MKQIAVIGGGSWGTALALLLTNNGNSVKLWSINPEVVENINVNKENSGYLPGFSFNGNITATLSMAEAVEGAEVVVMAVPSEGVRQVAGDLAKVITGRPLIVNASKGLESDTGLRLTQVIAQELPGIGDSCVALSGPNLAIEIARQVPSATVVASCDEDRAREAQQLFVAHHLRVYRSSDVAGVELGGALKNVYAIGAGISDGLGYGDNTKAVLLTRGLAEMVRLGEAMGAQPKTFMGLAGIGDLIATSASKLSRNLRVGYALGQGKTLAEAAEEVKQVSEGVPTCKAAYTLAESLGVYVPIMEQLYKVMFDGKSPRTAVADLMMRESKEE